MKIQTVLEKPKRGRYSVYAVCSNRGDCELLDFLYDLDNNLEKSREALLATISRAASHGREGLSVQKCHNIADEIFQFSGGKLRAAWFYDKGSMIICTHAYQKTGNKTKVADKKRAIAAREAYFEAKKNGTLEILPDEEGT